MEKKTILLILIFTVLISCSKKHVAEPIVPVSTATPVQTWTSTVTTSVTHSPVTSTHTQTITFTLTVSLTSTSTITPNATLTAIVEIPSLTAMVSLVSVPGGTFTQTDEANQSFIHTISPYLIGKYEVTYQLWYTVHQWGTLNGYIFVTCGAEGRNTMSCGRTPSAARFQPVVAISWREAIVWCNAYSQMSGLNPVYFTDAGFTIPIKVSVTGNYPYDVVYIAPGQIDNPYVNWNSNGYRLPTEGEWQFAAAYIDGVNWTPPDYPSGSTAVYYNMTATSIVSWWQQNSGFQCHAVGTKQPNALGIHDMNGNAGEWCWDWWCMDYYYPGTSTNYRGPAFGASINPSRTFRGGCAVDTEILMQLGRRYADRPFGALVSNGLRVARTY